MTHYEISYRIPAEELLREVECRAEELRAVIKEGERIKGDLEKKLAILEEKVAASQKRISDLGGTVE